ncbi:cysteine hydrolase [Vallitalea sediminicola]
MNKKAALLIVDMLYDFAHPDGKVFYPQNQEILPRIREVIDHCREKNILIIFARHYHRKYLFDKELGSGRRVNCLEGSGGENIMPELGYQEKTDYIVNKRRYNSFCGTDLDLILREHDIRNLLICGTKTNCCIRATVEGAYHLDYNPIVIKECVATNDEVVNNVHLADIEKYLGSVITMNKLYEKLDGGEFND